MFLQNLLTAYFRRIQEKAYVDIENLLKADILDSIILKDFSYVSNVHSGEWMNKITNDVSVIAKNAVTLIPNSVSIFLHITFSIVVLGLLSSDFLFFSLFLFCLILCIEIVFYKKVKIYHKDVQEKDGYLRSFIQECINSVTIVKTYQKVDFINKEFADYANEYRDARLKKNYFSVLMNFLFGIGINGMLILGIVYCAYGIYHQTLGYGTLVAVLHLISQMKSPLANMYVNIPNYYSMIGSAERLMESEKYDSDEAVIGKDFYAFYENEYKELEIKDLCFEYRGLDNERQVIDDFCMNIEKGDFIAISGPSGCGKSTLFKLLLCLYKPSNGSILLKTDEKDYILSNSWRKLFAYVPQDNQLMKGSIKDVVCFGDEYDKTKMEQSLKISCCAEFIDKLPQGIDYPLKEKGNGLSEGQMQRISIARAIYSDRPILLLDEATSALNEELEYEIMNNLKKMTDKTVLFISHHRNTMKYADKIIICNEEDGVYKWKADDLK